MAVRIQVRRGTAAQWVAADPVLAAGEQGLESDTGWVKIGNGSDAWTGLEYEVSREDLQAVESDNVAGGTLGATYTLNLAGKANRGLEATMGANLALTVAGFPPGGRHPLLLAQDATGGRTLTINGTAILGIPTDPSAPFVVWLYVNSAGTDFYVHVPSTVTAAGPVIPDDGSVTDAKVAVSAAIAQSKLAPIILSQYDRDQGFRGILAPPRIGSDATRLLAANTAYCARVRPSRAMTIVNFVFYVSTFATADDPVDVGIYSWTSGTNLQAVVRSGATSGKLNTATGRKSIALAATLSPGTTYYAVLACGAVGGTAATLAGFNAASGADNLTGSLIPDIMGASLAASHPLPSTLVFPGTGSGTFPRYFLSEV